MFLEAIFAFLAIRIVQRIYWLLFGYPTPRKGSLNDALAVFFKDHDITVESSVLISQVQGDCLGVTSA
jgi:hypothetical protein